MKLVPRYLLSKIKIESMVVVMGVILQSFLG